MQDESITEGKEARPFPHKFFLKGRYLGVIHHPNDLSIIIYTLGTRIEVGEFNRRNGRFNVKYSNSDYNQIKLALEFRNFLNKNNLRLYDEKSRLNNIKHLREKSSEFSDLASKLENINRPPEYEI